MALYLVERTDYNPDQEFEFTSAVVRAKGRLQARKLITRGVAELPYPGVKADGSNLRVSRIEDNRESPNAVTLVAYS
ncbi:hypothetical protein [Streptomyces avermitilis]|uniref:hypothetical protein n=1 Tax=Streptomyces avermitilis TaxID=33903 RepID=UPI0037FFD2FF